MKICFLQFTYRAPTVDFQAQQKASDRGAVQSDFVINASRDVNCAEIRDFVAENPARERLSKCGQSGGKTVELYVNFLPSSAIRHFYAKKKQKNIKSRREPMNKKYW